MSDQASTDQSALSAEFDTVAEWTAEVALDQGAGYFVAAGCRGSGSPAALEWFIGSLDVRGTDRMVDVGAGVGGPAAFAAERTAVRPLLVEPEAGACRAAARLFDLPVVRADATAMPFPDGAFDVAWLLGVLCTAPDDAAQLAMLRSLRRVITPTGRIGALVFVAHNGGLPQPPHGNRFPTASELPALIRRAGLEVVGQADAAGLAAAPQDWQSRERRVDDELRRRYGFTEQWQTAQEQTDRIGRLLSEGRLSATLLHLVRDNG